MNGRAALALAAVATLAACGDDLESRQAAVEEQQPVPAKMTMERPPAAPAPAATTDGFDAPQDDDDQGDEKALETESDPLMDSAQGLDPVPLDDTSGFDPTPIEPEGFAPEPIGPETFEE